MNFLEEKGKDFERNILSRFPATTYYKRLPRRKNVTMINGGVAANVIPGEYTFTVDVRTIPEENAERVAEEILHMLRNFAKESGMDIEIKLNR